MAIVIGVGSQKGGVGKSTIARLIAAEYARLYVAKLRGSDRRGYPMFVYEKAYHRFLPIDIDIEEINEESQEASETF